MQLFLIVISHLLPSPLPHPRQNAVLLSCPSIPPFLHQICERYSFSVVGI